MTMIERVLLAFDDVGEAKDAADLFTTVECSPDPPDFGEWERAFEEAYALGWIFTEIDDPKEEWFILSAEGLDAVHYLRESK